MEANLDEPISKADKSTLDERFRNADESTIGDVLRDLMRRDGAALERTLRREFPTLGPHIEDIIADALVRVWASRCTYDPKKATLRVWFFAIARNVARDLMQRGWGRNYTPDVTDIAAGLQLDLKEFSAYQKRLLEALVSLDQIEYEIVVAWSRSGDGDAWADELSKRLKIEYDVEKSPGALRVQRLRILNRLRDGGQSET